MEVSPVVTATPQLRQIVTRATCACLMLVFMPACGPNRELVAVRTQVQVMNSNLADRRENTDKELEVLSELVRQNTKNLERATKHVVAMQQTLARSRRTQTTATLVRRTEKMRTAAEELDRMMTDIEAHTQANNQLLQQTLYPSQSTASDDEADGSQNSTGSSDVSRTSNPPGADD